MEIIAIDLGSNTLRIITRNCTTQCFVNVYEKMVKTADGLIDTNVISVASVSRIIDALHEADTLLDFKNKKIYAVTTAAMRQALNSATVLEDIYKHSGIQFNIIDAQKEAYLTHLGVTSRMATLGYHSDNAFFLVDVGGGSTEVIYSVQDNLRSISLDVGIVTMSQKYTTKETLVAAMYEMFAPLKSFKTDVEKSQKASVLVMTAGTPTTLASLKQGMTVQTYDPTKINGTVLSREDLNFGLEKLLSMDAEDRATSVGVGRDILIIAGVEILKVIYEILGFRESVVIDDGLREGLAIEHCRNS